LTAPLVVVAPGAVADRRRWSFREAIVVVRSFPR